MCQIPCSSCFGSGFNNCLSCQSSDQTLKNGLCVKQPTFLIQIICCFLLILFVIPNLMRKRCVSLMRILDSIQIVFYFKYINGFLQNRHNYLYLGMRAWGQWSQGWNLLSISNDFSVPIWVIQQSGVNKIIRICIIWGGIVIVMITMGLLKTMMGDSQITLSNYIAKNLPITMCLGFYINAQDMSFIIANSFNFSLSSSPFSNTYTLIQFAVAIAFVLIAIVIMIWMFYTINFDYERLLEKTPKKIYPHVYMFFFALDYDLFQTYELTSLPQKQKRINRYSNLRVIDIFKKIAYSFLIVNSLYAGNETLNGQIFSILGFLVFFNLLWYVSLPYDLNTQKLQFAISVLADILTIVILILPLIVSNEVLELVLCLSLFALAIISLSLEMYLDVYSIIPVDLYETGLSIIIEDKKLLKQIQQRKKLQQQHQKLMKQIQEQNKKLKDQLQAQKTTKQPLKDHSQQSLPNAHDREQDQKFSEQILGEDKNNDMMHPINEEFQQKTSMNSDDLAGLYQIDQQKRRKIYQFNKKAEFTYSNKVQY